MLSRLRKKIKKSNSNDKSRYIFYKIVDAGPTEFEYILHCIRTNVFFSASIIDLIYDSFFLPALYPAQACFIGTEYAKYLHMNHSSDIAKYPKNREMFCRYGTYTISYQNRRGIVCFIDQTSDQQFFMDPRDIASSKDLIEYFDASQAFYIGLLAGLQTQKADKNKTFEKQPSHVTLKVIK